ncbi:MAG: excinuclease ABC subunit UvrC [Christensenellaceae bacterium]|nr:excinuclease ABC subunit UvrC [Christensenellaceae bacterium]
MISEYVENKLKTLPSKPGVYIMRSESGRVIYVGKAKILKNRVRQYFGSTKKQAKVEAMVSNIADFEYIITNTEVEALILESNLIKKHKPYYNILLRDDKQFPYVRIDMRERFPAIEIVRSVKKDGAKYFGPFLAAHSIKEMLDAVHKLFPIRSCRKDLSKQSKNARPCLNYQMGTCLGPCAGLADEQEYKRALNGVIELLSGKQASLKKKWEQEMMSASEALDFERAAVIRDRIKVLNRISEKQNAGAADLRDSDVFASACTENYSVVQAFFVRGGKLSLTDRFFLDSEGTNEEVLESFLKQFYSDKTQIPKKIYISEQIEDAQVISEWLSGIRGSKVEIINPKRGENKQLCDMAKNNAEQALLRKEQSDKKEFERTVGAAHALGEILGLGYIKRMECYDISNTQGTDSVASMVVFTDGKPNKKEYRRFRIKTVEGANDFMSMQEVLTRRFIEGFNAEDNSTGFGAMPDLIVIDGGKGQLGMAMGVAESMGLEDIGMIGLAKREEEIFLPGKSDPIILKKNSPELKLLIAIRDEAHRFAITYHRTLREKRTFESILDNISGVGPKKKAILLDRFGDIDGIKNASLKQLMDIKGLDATTARSIYRYFNGQE